MAIIGYNELEERKIAANLDVEAISMNGNKPLPKGITYKLLLKRSLELRVKELESHMELQCRNEKLRTKNGKLIEIISGVRGALASKKKCRK